MAHQEFLRKRLQEQPSRLTDNKRRETVKDISEWLSIFGTDVVLSKRYQSPNFWRNGSSDQEVGEASAGLNIAADWTNHKRVVDDICVEHNLKFISSYKILKHLRSPQPQPLDDNNTTKCVAKDNCLPGRNAHLLDLGMAGRSPGRPHEQSSSETITGEYSSDDSKALGKRKVDNLEQDLGLSHSKYEKVVEVRRIKPGKPVEPPTKKQKDTSSDIITRFQKDKASKLNKPRNPQVTADPQAAVKWLEDINHLYLHKDTVHENTAAPNSVVDSIDELCKLHDETMASLQIYGPFRIINDFKDNKPKDPQKTINLHQARGYARPSGNRFSTQNKRQKIGQDSFVKIGSQGSSVREIGAKPLPTTSQHPPILFSEDSYTRNTSQPFDMHDHSKRLRQVIWPDKGKSARRNERRQLNSSSSESTGRAGHSNGGYNDRANVKAEDPKDPIEDPEDLDAAPISPRLRSKGLKPVVLFDSSPESSRDHVAKPGANSEATRKPPTEALAAQTTFKSPYFEDQDRKKERKASPDVKPVADPEYTTSPRKHTIIRDRSMPSLESNNYTTSDGEADELEGYSSTPAPLLRHQRSGKLAEDIEVMQDSPPTRADIPTRGNIKPTYFSSKPKRMKVSSVKAYGLQAIISENSCLLLPDSLEPWTVQYDNPLEKLCFRKGESSKPEMEIERNAMHKLIYSPNSSVLTVHTSKLATGSKLYLQLDNIGHAAEFSATLHEKAEIRISKREDGEWLEKAMKKCHDDFLANQQRQRNKPKAKLAVEIAELEPEDLRLIKHNSNKRADQANAERQKDKPSGRRLVHASMRLSGRQSEVTEGDDVDTQPSSIDAKEFYENPTQTRAPARQRKRDLTERSRTRTPSPPRWSDLNPEWAEKWQISILYPQNKVKKATVDKQDIPRLDEGCFLNDNLIEFYLRWLENKLEQDHPEISKRVYFQNTFFYQRLTQRPWGKDSRINYGAVERWTQKVKLFDYDYIVVPVNEHLHWYLAIICNARRLLEPDEKETVESQFSDVAPETSIAEEAPTSKLPHLSHNYDEPLEDDMQGMTLEAISTEPRELGSEVTSRESPEPQEILEHDSVEPQEKDAITESPPTTGALRKGKRKSAPVRTIDSAEFRIITLDSLGGKHSPTCTNLKSYLVAEAKSKLSQEIPSPGAIGMTATNIPQQDNYCDCGLFLLDYIEQFLKQPDEFVSHIMQPNSEIKVDWQKPSEMRSQMRDILFGLQQEQAANTPKKQKKTKRAAKADTEASSPAKLESVETPRNAEISITDVPTPDQPSVSADVDLPERESPIEEHFNIEMEDHGNAQGDQHATGINVSPHVLNKLEKALRDPHTNVNKSTAEGEYAQQWATSRPGDADMHAIEGSSSSLERQDPKHELLSPTPDLPLPCGSSGKKSPPTTSHNEPKERAQSSGPLQLVDTTEKQDSVAEQDDSIQYVGTEHVVSKASKGSRKEPKGAQTHPLLAPSLLDAGAESQDNFAGQDDAVRYDGIWHAKSEAKKDLGRPRNPKMSRSKDAIDLTNSEIKRVKPTMKAHEHQESSKYTIDEDDDKEMLFSNGSDQHDEPIQEAFLDNPELIEISVSLPPTPTRALHVDKVSKSEPARARRQAVVQDEPVAGRFLLDSGDAAIVGESKFEGRPIHQPIHRFSTPSTGQHTHFDE